MQKEEKEEEEENKRFLAGASVGAGVESESQRMMACVQAAEDEVSIQYALYCTVLHCRTDKKDNVLNSVPFKKWKMFVV